MPPRRSHVALALVLAVTMLTAGCLNAATGSVTTAAAGEGARAHVVLAFRDLGINPYHVDFRDDSPLAFEHPSTYLPGYPEDAIALNLTLDAASYTDAVAADREEWERVEIGQLYWVPGTRIVGGIAFSENSPVVGEERTPCHDYGFLDCVGHGTMVASRGAGSVGSLCPECRILMMQGYASDALEWLGEQPWADVQSNSWGSTPNVVGTGDVEALARTRPVFFATGNGLAYGAGVVGQPAMLSYPNAAPSVILVGGHDNGRVITWTGTFPHVAADACASRAAASDSVHADRRSGGTSAAAPYAAGAGAALVLEARTLLADATGGVREGGVLAVGDAGRVPAGPLADGDLTLDELRDVLLATADPRPEGTPDDGDACSAASAYATTPVEWRDVPENVPQYYFTGYGVVNVDTLDAARAVLAGDAPVPERPVEDAFFQTDRDLKRALLPS